MNASAGDTTLRVTSALDLGGLLSDAVPRAALKTWLDVCCDGEKNGANLKGLFRDPLRWAVSCCVRV